MKMMIVLQRILALVVIIIGIVLMLSEVPMNGLLDQAWLTCGGLFIVLLSIGWEWLINKEEGFIHETR